MIADQPQRSQAIAAEHSFIVQAPAGSGKTELLIQRYLRLLALVDSPEEIVAITFTRKAAAEMQARVLAALDIARRSHQPESEHQRLTLELAEQVLKRDQSLGWSLLETPGRLRIQTIDSLCAQLSRQMPLLAQSGSLPETVDDARHLYEQATNNALSKLESDQHWSAIITSLLQHLDNDLPRLKRLCVNMLSKRDQWLRYAVAEHDRVDMEISLQHIIQQHLQKLTRSVPEDLANELLSLVRYAAENLCNTQPDSLIAPCHQLQQLPGDNVGDFQAWLAIRQLLMTSDGWRKRLTTKEGFPPPSSDKSRAELYKSMKQRMQTLLQQLQAHDAFRQLLGQITSLPSAQYEDDDWQVVGAMSKLLLLLEAELRLLFASNNQVDFTAVTQSAIAALGEDEAPTDLALYLDYQIHHLLVDEYQDISYSQYQLLQRLVAGWSVDDGKSIFLVGDPMQSIYRFREAEVGIFIQTWQQQRLHQLALTPLRLSVNFRSSKAIVDWVNQQFQSIMPGRDDIDSGAVSFSPCQTINQQGDARDIRLQSLLGRSDEQEAELVVAQVQAILNNSTEDTLAILVRSRTHLSHIIAGLKQQAITYRAIDIDPLADQSPIQDLLAMTRAYLHLADRVAWLAVLRGPCCGLTLQSLTDLLAQGRQQTVWQVLNDESSLQCLAVDERCRLLRLREVFNHALQNRQRQSLSRTIESIWLSLDGPAILDNAMQLRDVEAFFALLSRQQQAGALANLSLLTDAMQRLYASSDNHPDIRLQIMSMHKAKGLEFDHVIIPGLGRPPSSDDNELMLWMMKTDDDGQNLIMAPIKQAGADENKIYQYIKQHNALKQSYEDARLLYVASTRAKKTLTLIAHAKLSKDKTSEQYTCRTDKRSLLHHLWPMVEQQFTDKLDDYQVSQQEKDSTPIQQSLRRLAETYRRPPIQPLFHSVTLSNPQTEAETEVEYLWAGDTIKHIGTTVHRYIQHIAEQGLAQWNKQRLDAAEVDFQYHLSAQGVDKEHLQWATQRVKQALTNMLDDDRGQWILSAAHRQAENELALSGVVQGKVINIKIDRTFIDDEGVRWIIDYKTSRHEQADKQGFLDQEQLRYQQQLQRYAAIIAKLDEQTIARPINCGLYFPLLNGWREWSES